MGSKHTMHIHLKNLFHLQFPHHHQEDDKKKASRYQGHWSFQSPLHAVARHFWSAIISGESPHSSIYSSVWFTAKLYSPSLSSCITRNSQLPKLFRCSNCSTVHLNHFIRKTRDVKPWETITKFKSLEGSWRSLFMCMSLHRDSKKPTNRSNSDKHISTKNNSQWKSQNKKRVCYISI